MAEALKMVQNRSTGVSVILCFAEWLEQWSGAYEVRCEAEKRWQEMMEEKKINLPIKTINDIRKLGPCYDPSRHAPEDWTGTALDVLKAKQIPPADRLWVVLHEGWIDGRIMRLFAVWNGRKAPSLIANPDPRRVAVCDMAERFANGSATSGELAEAEVAARAAQVAHLIEMLEAD